MGSEMCIRDRFSGKTAGCDSAITGSIPVLPPNICPGDGIGIRTGLRNQVLRVRVSPRAPSFFYSRSDMTAYSRISSLSQISG